MSDFLSACNQNRTWRPWRRSCANRGRDKTTRVPTSRRRWSWSRGWRRRSATKRGRFQTCKKKWTAIQCRQSPSKTGWRYNRRNWESKRPGIRTRRRTPPTTRSPSGGRRCRTNSPWSSRRPNSRDKRTSPSSTWEALDRRRRPTRQRTSEIEGSSKSNSRCSFQSRTKRS